MGSKISPQPLPKKVVYQEDDEIEKLKLPYNLDRILRQGNIKSVGKFLKAKRKRLLRIKGIGKRYSWLLMKMKQTITVNYYKPTPKTRSNIHKYPQEEIFKHTVLSKEVFIDDPIDILEFPTRVENALKNEGIKTVGEFSKTPLEKMIKFRNIGFKSIRFFEQVQKQIIDNNPMPFKESDINEQVSLFNIKQEEQIPNDLLVGQLIERAGDERSIDIIKRRFGLANGERETLEEIGQDYGITRERVRQLQVKATRRIQHPSTRGRKGVISLVNSMLQQNGVVISDSEADLLARKVFSNSKFDGSSFLDLVSDLGWIQKNKIGDISFYTIKDTKRSLSQLVADIYTLLKNSKVLLSIDKILSVLISINIKYLDWGSLKIFIERICKLDPRIEEKAPGKFTLYGLNSRTNGWASLIREVLEKEDIPLHFTEIAYKVNDIQSNFENKHVDVRRVHAILIEKDEFSHSGVRGTYGLTEWGFRKETVSDLIEECIKKAGFPLHWKQIYSYVSKYKDTKQGNILALLNSQERFTRKGRGMYEVKNYK